METSLGRGYSLHEESGLTDFYSPPSSIIDEDEDFSYPEDEEVEEEEDLSIVSTNNITLSSSSVNEIKSMNLIPFKPSTLKLMPIERTPPPTPLIPRRLLDPINATTTAFQSMAINTNPLRSIDMMNSSMNEIPNKTGLLTPTSIDRYFTEHSRLPNPTQLSPRPFNLGTTTNRISVQHTEITNETSRLYSYMNLSDGLSSNIPTPSNFDGALTVPSQLNFKAPPFPPQRMNPFNNHSPSFHPQQYQTPNPWFLSEMSAMLHQQPMSPMNNISLSARAQEILAANTFQNNNRPLRSDKIDIELLKQLIREANWKQQCGMKKEICVFCRNNGENELIYSSHSLKDSTGNVTCPILRAYQCPICGATGAQAHTIKYCQATGDDSHRYVPTPYEEMIRMQTFRLEDNMSALFGQISNPSSLYSNGWSDSYL